MYAFVSVLLMVGLLMFLAGFIGSVGTNNLDNVTSSIASAIGFLTIFVIFIASRGSSAELVRTFSDFCGGIPYLKEIADYGTLKNFYSQEPAQAAVVFFDTAMIGIISDLVQLLPLGSTKTHVIKYFWRNALVGLVAVFISIFIFNRFIKPLTYYQAVITVIGSIISIISVGTIPVAISSLFMKKAIGGTGLFAALLIFSNNPIVGKIRSGFLKALVLVLGIGLLEKYYGNVANGLSNISTFLIAFGPVFISLVGMGLIISSVFKKD